MKDYRIVRLAGLHYPDTVRSFLDQRSDYSQRSYEDQLRRLFQDSPIFSDGFSRSFRNFGQEAIELVIDLEVLQKQWAEENGILYSPDNWMFDIMMAQIEALKPDVVYIQSHVFNIPGIFIKNSPNRNLAEILKDRFSFIRLVLLYSGYPSGADRIKGTDILFAGAPSLMALYRKMGFVPNLLYHAFDEAIIKKLDTTDKKYNFTFIGSTHAPESRYFAIKQLLEETNVEAWLYETKQEHENNLLILPIIKHVLRSFAKRGLSFFHTGHLEKYAESDFLPKKLRDIMREVIYEGYIKGIGDEDYPKIGFPSRKSPKQPSLREMYPHRCHAPVMGMDMYNLLHQSKVTFNKHSDLRWGGIGNMRMFEATGVGACLVTDAGKNMSDLFEADKEVVIYTSIDEAIEKVRYLMDHEMIASEIALAGQRRTLKDHSMEARCRQIDKVIQKNL